MNSFKYDFCNHKAYISATFHEMLVHDAFLNVRNPHVDPTLLADFAKAELLLAQARIWGFSPFIWEYRDQYNAGIRMSGYLKAADDNLK